MNLRTMITVWGVTAMVALLTLSGCGSSLSSNNLDDEETTSMWVDTVDGRRIPCVWIEGYETSGLSCDWSRR